MINSFAKCLQQPLPRAKRQIVSSNGFPFHIDLDLTVTGHVLVSSKFFLIGTNYSSAPHQPIYCYVMYLDPLL